MRTTSTAALVLRAPERLEAADLAVPELRVGEALLRVEACGLCGTDHELCSGVMSGDLPLVPGHEVVGVVAEATAEYFAAHDVVLGQRVALEVFQRCGRCANCLAGAYPLRQINGAAHFNEVFFTDVRIPDSDRLGETGSGWRSATTTLMNERVSIGSETSARGGGPIRSAIAAYSKAGSPLGAPRDRLSRLWSEAEVLRLAGIRAQQLRTRGAAGPEGSVLRLGKALLSQRIYEYALDVAGMAGLLTGGYPPKDHDEAATACCTRSRTRSPAARRK